jgi:hypothetical protein
MESKAMSTIAKPAKRKLTLEERRFRHIERHLKLRKQGSAKYDRSDQVLKKLKGILPVGELVPYKDGRFVRLKDNFADKDKVYRNHGISRFEVEVLDVNGKVLRNPD